MDRIDLLAFAPHPDDAEICCGGLLAKAAAGGRRTAIVDLCEGEMASQGDIETRRAEAQRAAEVLKLSLRENLRLPDSWLGTDGPDAADERHRAARQLQCIVGCIRRHRPAVVLAPYWEGRHPDHYRTSRMITEAVFFAALKKYVGLKSEAEKARAGKLAVEPAAPHKVSHLLYYQMRAAFTPSFISDISDVYDLKLESIRCHGSQVTRIERMMPAEGDGGDDAGTLVSSALSLSSIQARDGYLGAMIGCKYGEGFLTRSALRIDDPVGHFTGQQTGNSLYFP